MRTEPAYDGYLADPFLVRAPGGYVAYGSSEPFGSHGGSVQALTSPDLSTWTSIGTVFHGDPDLGSDVWAPEVVAAEGAWWMYYSTGFGIAGHHLRVARADSPWGPFEDTGVDLTPDESFAIDPHPFTDTDGTRHLFFAHDILDHPRPGTHLAVRRLVSPTELGPDTTAVLAPHAAWQLYEADRLMYGRRRDWYTLEGPTVTRHDGLYVLMFSGGSWEGPDYGVSYATAATVLGPWQPPASDVPLVLSRALTGLRGPGHNSILQLDDGSHVTAFHAWDETFTRRQLHLAPLGWDGFRPSIVAPI